MSMQRPSHSLPLVLRVAAGFGVVFGIVQVYLALSGDDPDVGRKVEKGKKDSGDGDDQSLDHHERLSRELARLLPGLRPSNAWRRVRCLFPFAISDAERVERLRISKLTKHDTDGDIRKIQFVAIEGAAVAGMLSCPAALSVVEAAGLLDNVKGYSGSSSVGDSACHDKYVCTRIVC